MIMPAAARLRRWVLCVRAQGVASDLRMVPSRTAADANVSRRSRAAARGLGVVVISHSPTKLHE
jgi:hypothetical protein